MINYHIKGLYETTCYKAKSNFSQVFFSHWLLHKCFFSFLIKAFANFEKLIRFNWQAFIVYKNGANLKMLIEIFCQKLIVSNVILAFLDIWNLKFSLSTNHGGWHRAPPFPKSLDPPLYCIVYEKAQCGLYWKINFPEMPVVYHHKFHIKLVLRDFTSILRYFLLFQTFFHTF